MEKYKIITISMLVLGFVLFVSGISISSSLLTEIAGAIIVIAVIAFKIGDYEEKKSLLLESMENKDKSMLPQVKTIIRKKEIIPTIMSVIIVIIILAFLSVMLEAYFFKMGEIDIEKAVKDGCAKLNMGDTCITDPSKIIVPYDVNKDGTTGGINDTFSNLMRDYYNCTGSCIMKHCGCPG
jgi:hypothetical protein